jgi:hypothetical protein
MQLAPGPRGLFLFRRPGWSRMMSRSVGAERHQSRRQQMNKTVLVVLLAAAAGCGNKKSGPDCEAAIAKAIENSIKVLKERAPNPQIVEANLGIMTKAQGVLIERCKADGWPPEVVSCFTTASGVRDMQSCQGKLTLEQRSKLTAELSQVMTGVSGMQMGQRMPPGMAGHPEMLTPNPGAGAAPAPGAPAGSSDTPAAPGAAAPSATPPAPSAPAGSTAPAAGGSAPK